MTTDGTDASYSPVPSAPYAGPPAPPWASPTPQFRPVANPYVQQPPSGTPHAQAPYAPPTPYAPYGPPRQPYVPPGPPPTTVTPPAKKASGRGPVVLVGVLVVALGLIVAVGIAGSRYVAGTKEVSSADGRVTLTVPRSWTDYTDEDLEENGYVPPALDYGDFFYDNDARLYLESKESEVTLAQVHQDEVDDLCAAYECTGRGTATTLTIAERPALQTTVQDLDGSVVITSVVTDRWLVTLEGETSAFEPGPEIDRLLRIAQSLIVRD